MWVWLGPLLLKSWRESFWLAFGTSGSFASIDCVLRILIEQIRTALGGHAQVVGIYWISSSRFHLRLRLFPEIFRHCSVAVQLIPRELPLSWLLSWYRNQRETLTFEADLDVPPSFSLEVHNQRWSGALGGEGLRLMPIKHSSTTWKPWVRLS